MVTLYKTGNLPDDTARSYTKKQDIDTRIPPKAKPVFNKISVNGITIEEAEILAEAQNHPADTPGDALSQAARALVIRELLWQEAQRLGLAPDKNNPHQTTETPVDSAIRQLVEQEINVPRAREDDCRRFYERSPARFASDMIVEARHILLAADPKDSQARKTARQKALTLIEELKADTSRFCVLARDYSSCPSAAQGGNLGQLTCGSTVPEFEEALKNGPDQGLVTTPVESRYGFHIVDILRKIERTPLPFEAVYGRIAAWLEASSWSLAVSQYITLLAGKAEIQGINILSAQGSPVQYNMTGNNNSDTY